jgi:predicted porin
MTTLSGLQGLIEARHIDIPGGLAHRLKSLPLATRSRQVRTDRKDCCASLLRLWWRFGKYLQFIQGWVIKRPLWLRASRWRCHCCREPGPPVVSSSDFSLRTLCIILAFLFAFRAFADPGESGVPEGPASSRDGAEAAMGNEAEQTATAEAADTRREANDAALDQDPEASRRILAAFERQADEGPQEGQRFFDLYGSIRVHAIRNGIKANNDGQKSGFSLGDGGSRIGARLRWNFTEGSQLFGLAEAGFNIFDVFSSNASSQEGDQNKALNPRLYYLSLDTPYLFATFGKNWSTYYKIAGMTDRFAIFGGNAAGVYNAGTDGGASGTGRANEVLQTRLYLDLFKRFEIKPFNLNVQYQRNQPIPQVDGARYGDQYGASAWFENEAGWGLGLAYNVSRIRERRSPAIVAAGIDGDSQALALSTRWSGDKWSASLVWTRQDNHATNDQDLYVDGNGVELYAQWEFRDRWWLVGGGNWFNSDDRDPQAGEFEIDQTIIGLRRTVDSFNRMLYAEYMFSNGSGFFGDKNEDQLTLGIRWDFGYGSHRPFEFVGSFLETLKKL